MPGCYDAGGNTVFISGVSLFQGCPYLEVSLFQRFPYFRVSLFQRCLYFRGVLISEVSLKRGSNVEYQRECCCMKEPNKKYYNI